MPHLHEPRFDDTGALFILNRVIPEGGRQITVCASTDLTAVLAAWEAVQDRYFRDQLTLQQGARIMRSRDPIEACRIY